MKYKHTNHTPVLLDKFKTNIINFAIDVTKADSFNNPVKINQLLIQFDLFGTQIVDKYTKKFSHKTTGNY
jgi:hypothetical protein